MIMIAIEIESLIHQQKKCTQFHSIERKTNLHCFCLLIYIVNGKTVVNGERDHLCGNVVTNQPKKKIKKKPPIQKHTYTLTHRERTRCSVKQMKFVARLVVIKFSILQNAFSELTQRDQQQTTNECNKINIENIVRECKLSVSVANFLTLSKLIKSTLKTGQNQCSCLSKLCHTQAYTHTRHRWATLLPVSSVGVGKTFK